MKLNHVNLTSIDVPADVAMFETYFGLHRVAAGGKNLAVLEDEDGMLFVLNNFKRPRGDFKYPDDSDVLHIGFIQDSRDAVDVINARLVADGWDAPTPRDYHGAWTFYFKAKGGYFIEVATRTRFGEPRQGSARGGGDLPGRDGICYPPPPLTPIGFGE